MMKTPFAVASPLSVEILMMQCDLETARSGTGNGSKSGSETVICARCISENCIEHNVNTITRDCKFTTRCPSILYYRRYGQAFRRTELT